MTKPGYGTINNPLALQYGVSYPWVSAGDTVYLRGGTYSSADYTFALTGTALSRITVKPYNNERVIIDGALTLSGDYCDFIDLEITWKDWPWRYSATDTEWPAGAFDHNGGAVISANNRLINCTIYDNMQPFATIVVPLIYGCIFWNSGFIGADSVTPAHGHSLYFQHADITNRKVIKHNVFGRSASYTLHGYGTNQSLKGVDIQQNVILSGNSLLGGQELEENLTITDNHLYGGGLTIGYSSGDNLLLTFTGNVLINSTPPLQIIHWATATVTGNTIIKFSTAVNEYVFNFLRPAEAGAITWNNNVYVNKSSSGGLLVSEDGVGYYTFAQWKSTFSYDADSTFGADYPADSVTVWVNDYAAVSKRKGLVVIHNYTLADAVNIDLSTLAISAGETYKLMNAQDPLNDTITGTMPAGSIISVDMKAVSHTVENSAGWTAPATSFPIFGAFVVEKVA